MGTATMSAASNWPALWRTWQTVPLLNRWNGRSLAHQFLFAGGVVSLAEMVAVGLLVTKLIETGVTRNSAATTALYVDSIIAPLLPDMQTNEVLGDTVTRALDETLGQGALGRRLVSFKLWRRDGTILDGPAQLVALASLKLDSAALLDPNSSAEERERIAFAIKSSLDGAVREIRSICNGLVLLHIESAQLTEVLALAVSEHEQRTDARIELSLSNPPQSLSPSAKICIYRFVQEALNNGYRHSNGAWQSVMLTSENGQIFVEVCDNGPGFDPTVVRPGCLGLAGLRERVESLGGGFEIESSSNGTKLKCSSI